LVEKIGLLCTILYFARYTISRKKTIEKRKEKKNKKVPFGATATKQYTHVTSKARDKNSKK